MKILIRFGDNDFGAVLRAFGELLGRESIWDWNTDFLNKKNIVEWFNAIAPTLYYIVQNRGRYQGGDIVSKYLQIREANVHLNEEVDEQMKTWASWGNGDSVLIDMKPTEYPMTPTVTIV